MARTFNGSSDKLSYAGAVVSANPLTLACWWNRTGTVAGTRSVMGVYASGSSSVNHQYTMERSNGATVTVGARHGNGSSSAVSTSGSIAPGDNVWVHAAAVFASDTSRTSYVNGTASTTNTTSITGTTGLDRSSLGNRDNTSADRFHIGAIAEAAIWNVALTAAEIASLAAGVCPLLVRPTSLVAYWPIIGQYSPEIDVKGGYGMTVSGTTVANHVRQYYAAMPLQLGVPDVIPPATSQSNLLLLGVG